MGLKSTRCILSILLSAIIAVSVVLASASFVFSQSMTQKGIERGLISSELVSACEKQLETKYNVLETKSGIPAHVFNMVIAQYDTRSSLTQAVANLFDENDSSLYNENKVEYFYSLCTEYLDGNELEYNEDDIMRTADEAARIYSDCVGIHDADSIRYYIANINKKAPKVESAAILAIALSVVMLIMLYNNKADAYSYMGAGASGGAIATIIGAVLAIVTKAGASNAIAPLVYQNCFYSIVKYYLLYLLGFGFIVFVVAVLLLVFSFYKLNQEKTRKEIRFKKIVAKL